MTDEGICETCYIDVHARLKPINCPEAKRKPKSREAFVGIRKAFTTTQALTR